MGAARKLTPLKTMSRALVKAVARLDPDVAVARLAAYHAAEPPGMRRRALLAARIELIRKAMEAPPKPVVVVVPEPEPVVEPPPPPVAIVPPKPLSKGVMTSINLDDVAKMLMASPDPEPEPVAALAPEVPAGAVAMQDVAAAFAALDWGDSAEQVEVSAEGEAALWSDLAGGTGGLSNPAIAASAPGAVPAGREKPGAMDLSLAFAALNGADEEEAAPVMAEPKAASLDLAAQFAGLGADEAVAEVVEPPAPAGGIDAAFALLGDLGAQEEAAESAPVAMDLAAQFAALGEEEAGEANTRGEDVGQDGVAEAAPTQSAPDTPLLDEDGVELSALQLAMLRRAQRRAAEG